MKQNKKDRLGHFRLPKNAEHSFTDVDCSLVSTCIHFVIHVPLVCVYPHVHVHVFFVHVAP